jgi:hypothetical protein
VLLLALLAERAQELAPAARGPAAAGIGIASGALGDHLVEKVKLGQDTSGDNRAREGAVE